MKDPSTVMVSELNLSTRAADALTAALPSVRNPYVRQVVEEVTASRLRELPGVGAGTVAEIEGALMAECGVSLIGGRRVKAAPVVEAEAAEPVADAPAKASRGRKATNRTA